MAGKRRPKLVTQYLENISREGFDKHGDIIRRFVGKRKGVYALFRRGKLYYAGLAGDLRWRLKSHSRDRHRDSWDTFSVYLTIGDQHLRELESLIIRITQPPGNKQLGRFSGAQDLRRKFGAEISREQRGERDRILGQEREKEETVTGRSIPIRAKYKGKLVRARLRPDRRIRYNKKLYTSPSQAAAAVLKRARNGWTFWHYERSPGDWVPIDALRNG